MTVGRLGIHRISVIGTSGSGKSTVARRMADILGAPYVELDALHWGPDWTPASPEEFADQVRDATAGESWVVDGNYQSKLGSLVRDRADTVVWVDAPRWRATAQVVARTARRAATKQELWNGNRETWRGFWLWRGDDSVIHWAWTSYRPTRERYEVAMREAEGGSGPRWHRLRTRRAVERFLHAVERGAEA